LDEDSQREDDRTEHVADEARFRHADQVGLGVTARFAWRGGHLVPESAEPTIERAVGRTVVAFEILVVKVMKLIGLKVVFIARVRGGRADQ